MLENIVWQKVEKDLFNGQDFEDVKDILSENETVNDALLNGLKLTDKAFDDLKRKLYATSDRTVRVQSSSLIEEFAYGYFNDIMDFTQKVETYTLSKVYP